MKDYQNEHPDYALDVIFAVLADEMKAMGEKALSAALPKGVAPTFFQIVRFHRTEEENGYLSNWYLRDFELDGKNYCCVEQYMMEQKALLFSDFEMAGKIMQTKDQQEMQDLGRAVRNFDSRIWDGQKQLIVYTGLLAKFGQNPDLLGRLIETGTATPVECSRSDRIWGIGLGMDDLNAANPSKWNGQNLLGFALKATRTELMRRMLKSAKNFN